MEVRAFLLVISKLLLLSMCYNNCKKGHRIKIIDDFFGLSTFRTGPDTCHYVPGDCTITNSRYSSVIHRYCEGLETCTRFQVDRRNCGSNLTNYEQVEYECVSEEGYISTPNFPNEYTPNSHCRCTLRTQRDGVFVRLSFTQFIIKYDNPCKDWVEVLLDGDIRRLCGAYRKRSKPPTTTQKTDKIQDRLNSLSFYDSIPLYDSIGRNGGVARAPPIGDDIKINTKSLEGAQYIAGSKLVKSDGPYWTNIQRRVRFRPRQRSIRRVRQTVQGWP
ncbi:hypothetical protein LSH36_87g06063 [Paralvinella palmiformis]|uniref:CUB domain-containing protein n=1 Tax=Paralvinella palmiformis TaxID=53620 RepID=A0AAD9K2T3_9ANNE|nr:hypothetical protein LSH36_87g06063 [Paralvinella palmiformis]